MKFLILISLKENIIYYFFSKKNKKSEIIPKKIHKTLKHT